MKRLLLSTVVMALITFSPSALAELTNPTQYMFCVVAEEGESVMLMCGNEQTNNDTSFIGLRYDNGSVAKRGNHQYALAFSVTENESLPARLIDTIPVRYLFQRKGVTDGLSEVQHKESDRFIWNGHMAVKFLTELELETVLDTWSSAQNVLVALEHAKNENNLDSIQLEGSARAIKDFKNRVARMKG